MYHMMAHFHLVPNNAKYYNSVNHICTIKEQLWKVFVQNNKKWKRKKKENVNLIV